MDTHKPSDSSQISFKKLSNGFVLPAGKLTPNTLFVGGIDMKVNENEMQQAFAKYGAVKEVKIITYRGGICKGYGFVYFNEDVNIQSIVEQQISLKGRKLKLGPAIMKDRSSRSVPSHLVNRAPLMSPNQYILCSCCSNMGGSMALPSVFNGNIPYNQPYPYATSYGDVMVTQMPMNYLPNPYAYQYTPSQWMPDQRTRPVNQNFADYADCALVHSY